MPIISSISCMILERELGIIMHNNLSTRNGPLSWTGRSSVEELLGGVAQLHSSAHARASFAMQSRASLHREHFLSATDHPDSDKDYRRQSPVNLHMQKDLSIWPRPTLLPSYIQSAQVRRMRFVNQQDDLEHLLYPVRLLEPSGSGMFSESHSPPPS